MRIVAVGRCPRFSSSTRRTRSRSIVDVGGARGGGDLRAGGSPPPAHFHPAQDEHFEVLAGLTVRAGGEERILLRPALGDARCDRPCPRLLGSALTVASNGGLATPASISNWSRTPAARSSPSACAREPTRTTLATRGSQCSAAEGSSSAGFLAAPIAAPISPRPTTTAASQTSTPRNGTRARARRIARPARKARKRSRGGLTMLGRVPRRRSRRRSPPAEGARARSLSRGAGRPG